METPRVGEDIPRECDGSLPTNIGQMWEQQRKPWEPKGQSTERSRRRRRTSDVSVQPYEETGSGDIRRRVDHAQGEEDGPQGGSINTG